MKVNKQKKKNIKVDILLEVIISNYNYFDMQSNSYAKYCMYNFIKYLFIISIY